MKGSTMGPLRLFGWSIRACVLLVLIAPSGTGEEPKAPQYGPEVQKRLDALRAKGEPVTLDDLTPEPIPPEQNAATIYLKAFAAYVELEDEDVKVLVQRASSEFPPEGLAKVRQWIQQNQQALVLTERASAMEKCRFIDRYVGMYDQRYDHLSLATRLALLLSASARAHLAENDPQSALKKCRAQLGLGRHLGRGRTLVEYLVAHVHLSKAADSLSELLSHPGIGHLELRPVVRDVRRLLEAEHLADAFRTERVFLLSLLSDPEHAKEVFLDPELHFDNRDRNAEHGHAMKSHGDTRVWIEQETLVFLEAFAEIISLAEAPYYQGAAARRQVQDWLEEEVRPRALPMATLTLPKHIRYLQLGARRRVPLLHMTLAIELEMHQRATGSYPESLDGLKLTYLEKLPVDPFSGRPFVYRKKDGGYILYSVGPNGRDDGGVPGHPGDRTDDIVWSVTRKESN